MARAHRQVEPGSKAQVMTVDQVADYLQLNRLTVYRYVREGKIPASKIGKVYRILRADVDRFLESRKMPAARSQPRSEGAEAPARPATVWVREFKQPHEIAVGPSRRDKPQPRDRLVLSGDPIEVVVRGFH